jgi:hypothetical protein
MSPERPTARASNLPRLTGGTGIPTTRLGREIKQELRNHRKNCGLFLRLAPYLFCVTYPPILCHGCLRWSGPISLQSWLIEKRQRTRWISSPYLSLYVSAEIVISPWLLVTSPIQFLRDQQPVGRVVLTQRKDVNAALRFPRQRRRSLSTPAAV